MVLNLPFPEPTVCFSWDGEKDGFFYPDGGRYGWKMPCFYQDGGNMCYFYPVWLERCLVYPIED
jgi:hypothetical protein